ncbi:MAG: acetylglutamate kinase [Bacillota bacterium]|jgi:hypothetical protein
METRFFRWPRRISSAELRLNQEFRLLWEQHGAWTRMTIISLVFGLPDTNFVVQRLLRNPDDFRRALEPFYGREAAFEFAHLLRDHLVIASELVTFAKKGDTRAAEDAERRWYVNADQIAAFLASINPFWSRNEWQRMLREHLALVKREAVEMLQGQYEASIQTYDEMEMQILTMADEMTRGIVKQFPRRFF